MSDIKGKKAIIYARVSSRRQVEEGHGLDSQIKICEEYGDRLGLQIEEVFTDTITGKTAKRDGLDGALQFLRRNKSKQPVILIDDIDRLAREVKGHWSVREDIEKAGGQLYSPRFKFGSDANSRYSENIHAASAQYFREKNLETVLERMRARILSGYWCLRAPLGYEFRDVPGHGRLIAPIEDVQEPLAEILEGFACGRFETQSEVKRYIESRPEFARYCAKSGRFKLDRVRDVLKQILYSGHILYPRWNVTLRKAHHQALISLETHQKILDRLNGKPVAPIKQDRSEDFPLRGCVQCSECGHHLTSNWSKGKNKWYPYYFCCYRKCSKFKKSIRRDELDGSFETLLAELEPHEELFSVVRAMLEDIWNDRSAVEQSRKKQLAKKLRTLEDEVEQLVDRIIQSNNDRVVAAYEDKLERLQMEQVATKEKLDNLTVEEGSFEDLFEHSMEFLSSPCKIWKNGDYVWQRTVLRLAFSEKLTYCSKEGLQTPKFSFPFRVLSDAKNRKGDLVEPRGIEPLTSCMPCKRSPS